VNPGKRGLTHKRKCGDQHTGRRGAQGPPLTAEEEAAIAEGRAQAARGKFASAEAIRAFWAKYGP
jgi:hypothetical protein